MNNVVLLFFFINVLVINYLLFIKGEQKIVAIFINFLVDGLFLQFGISVLMLIIGSIVKLLVVLYLLRVKYVYDSIVTCDYYIFKLKKPVVSLLNNVLGIFEKITMLKEKIYNLRVSNSFAFIVAAILFSITSGVLFYANK